MSSSTRRQLLSEHGFRQPAIERPVRSPGRQRLHRRLSLSISLSRLCLSSLHPFLLDIAMPWPLQPRLL